MKHKHSAIPPKAVDHTEDTPLNIRATQSVVDIYDPANDRSVVNMLPAPVRSAILRLPAKATDKDLDTLTKDARPNATDARLKLKLWTHLSYVEGLDNNSIKQGLGRMSLMELAKGVCTPGYVTSSLIKNPDKLAWLMVPSADYELFMRECLQLCLDSVRRILAMPETTKDKKGKTVTDHRLVAQKVKLYEAIEARVKGPIQQRVQIDKRQLTMTQDISASSDLQALEKELERLQGLPEPVQDVLIEQGEKK